MIRTGNHPILTGSAVFTVFSLRGVYQNTPSPPVPDVWFNRTIVSEEYKPSCDSQLLIALYHDEPSQLQKS